MSSRGSPNAETGEDAATVIGREPELAVLRDFVSGGARALVVAGPPGIGKTTLWEAGLALAGEHGARVLQTRATTADARLSFAGLVDLLEGVDGSDLDDLRPPQRHALEVALLRADPGDAPADSHAIARGLLGVLRGLARGRRVLVAVDDAQWLDGPSADALAFAAPRLRDDRVSFLLTRRSGRRSALERALEPQVLDVAPLSLGAIRRLLAVRLGLSLSRQLLYRLVRDTLGNPLFALEVARTLAPDEPPRAGDTLPVPEEIEGLLGTRVAQLPEPTRRLLLAVTLDAGLTVSQLLSLASRAHLEQAVAEGVLAVDGDRVRPTHPLLGAAARKRSSPARRRDLHRELAAVASSEELRVLHLALATELPDPELAGAAADAAAAAAARGARREAVELSEHALRLTAADAPERPERLLALARRLEEAGDPKRLGALLLPAVDTLPPGEARVRAYVMLAEWAARKGDDPAPLLELGLAESGGDASLRALVLPAMAAVISVGGLQRFEEGEAWASEALVAAGELGREAERHAVAPLAWIRVLRGRPIDDLCERFPATTNTAWPIGESPERPASQRLAWRGDVEGARAAHLRLRALADQRGEAVSFVVQRLHLCELALRVGDCHAATRLLDEWLEVIDDEPIPRRVYERCRELLDVQRGTSERRRIDTRMPAAGRWDRLESLRACGIAALLAHDPPGAVECLRAVWGHTVREGIEEPGVFPAAPDLVEALVETGQTDESFAVIARLQKLAEEQEHPWGLATVDRCRGLVAFADANGGDGADGADLLARAAAGYERLGLRLDRARTLLLLGRAQRRHRRWAAAREALEAAVAAFDELGAPGWAQEARSELERVGARRPQARGALTPAELRVVELAVEGLTNKEIARTLFVSVKTVETHLSHVYAKLGVRTRVQLGGRL